MSYIGTTNVVLDASVEKNYMTSLQSGRTPLIYASRFGYVACVKVLLDRGALVNKQDKVSAFPHQTNVLIFCVMR